VADAGDGRAGLRLHATEPADVIITDIFMPDFDGIETIRELRRVSGGDSTGTMSMLDDAKKLGADRAFRKPMEPAKLLEAVRELLGANPPS
jgi:DNA-binding response OmpR family regulator